MMVQRYRPDELEMIGMHPESDGDYVDYADYIALERELQMIDELMARRPALDDCKTRYDKISKVITTAAQKDALERELDELKADNALLRKQIEEIEESRDEWRRQWYLSEAGLSAAEKEVERLRKRLEPVPEYLPDVNANEQCMELKEGR